MVEDTIDENTTYRIDMLKYSIRSNRLQTSVCDFFYVLYGNECICHNIKTGVICPMCGPSGSTYYYNCMIFDRLQGILI